MMEMSALEKFRECGINIMKEKEMLKLISNNLAMIISAKDALESLAKIDHINSESIKKLAEAIKVLESRLSKLEGRLIISLDIADEFQTEEDW